jgi:hypothetical protein
MNIYDVIKNQEEKVENLKFETRVNEEVLQRLKTIDEDRGVDAKFMFNMQKEYKSIDIDGHVKEIVVTQLTNDKHDVYKPIEIDASKLSTIDKKIFIELRNNKNKIYTPFDLSKKFACNENYLITKLTKLVKLGIIKRLTRGNYKYNSTECVLIESKEGSLNER